MAGYKKLGSLDVDGTTYAVDTWHVVYTVPSGKEAIVSGILILNRSTDNAEVRLAHTTNGVLPDTPLLWEEPLRKEGGRVTVRIGICMSAGDKLQIYSDTTNVNINIWGREQTA